MYCIRKVGNLDVELKFQLLQEATNGSMYFRPCPIGHILSARREHLALALAGHRVSVWNCTLHLVAD